MCRAPEPARCRGVTAKGWLRLLLVFGALSAMPAPACAQAVPAKPIDPSPLDRPSRLTSIVADNPAAVFARVRQAVRDAGFTGTRVDLDRLLLDAKRTDPADPKNYDRVLVWIERSLNDPLQRVDLYLLYGRYEEVVARRTDIYRVVVDEQFEADRIGALRERLIALGDTP